MFLITAGVGRGERNLKADVEIVQQLINGNLHRIPLQPPLVVDGFCGWRTETAIGRFQRSVMQLAAGANGRVRPNDATYQALMRCAAKPNESFVAAQKSGDSASAQSMKQTILNHPKGVERVTGPWTSEGPSPRYLSDQEMVLVDFQGRPFTPNNNIRWELPSRGLGFVTYNRNDDSGKFKELKKYPSGNAKAGQTILDQIGTKQTINLLMTLAREWFQIHPNRPLQIGDISFPGGYDTPDHKTHNNGCIVDIRPIRNDSKLGMLTHQSSVYSPDLTEEFIRLIFKLNPGTEKIYFNDPKLNRIFGEKVIKKAEHDNHLHVIFKS